MLNSFTIAAPAGGAQGARKRPRAIDTGVPLETGAVPLEEITVGATTSRTSLAPSLVIPLPSKAHPQPVAPVSLRAAKRVDDATMASLFAPHQVRIAPVQGRTAPLLPLKVGMGVAVAEEGREGGGSSSSSSSGSGSGSSSAGMGTLGLAEALNPQDGRYEAVPVGKFGAAMLRGMGAVVTEEEEEEGGGGGERGGEGTKGEQQRGKGGGNRSRLGLGAVPNPLLPQKPGSAAAIAHASAPPPGGPLPPPPPKKGLISHPYLIPDTVVRLKGAAAAATLSSSSSSSTPALALVLQVEGVPGMDKFRARVVYKGEVGAVGSRVVDFSINDTEPFEGGASNAERGVEEFLKREQERANAPPPPPPPPPVAPAAAAASTTATVGFPPGAVVRVKSKGDEKYRVVSFSSATQEVRVVSVAAAGGGVVTVVGVRDVETVITKVGGKVVIVGGGVHRGDVGVVAAIHQGSFCVDVELPGGKVVKSLEYEHVTKMS